MLVISLLFFSSVVHAGMDQPKLNAGKAPEGWDSKQNFTLLDDAKRPQVNCTIPWDRCEDMFKLTNAGAGDLNKTLESIRNIVCDGEKSKMAHQFRVLLVPPKTAPGTSLGRASEARTEFIDAARFYIKRRYLFDLGKAGNEAEVYAKDYQTAITGWNPIEKEQYKFAAPPTSGKSEIFVTESSDLKAIKASIEAVPYNFEMQDLDLTSLDAMVTVPRSFTTIQSEDGKDAILTGHVGLEVKTEWKKEDDGFEFQRIVVNPAWSQFYNQSFKMGKMYIVTGNSWLINGKTYKVLARGAIGDLHILSSLFTFMLPINVIKKLFNPEQLDLRKYGYESIGEKVKFSSDYALGNKDYLWEKVLASQTTVKEAAQEDGSVRFTLEPNLDLFCKYGVPAHNLVTH